MSEMERDGEECVKPNNEELNHKSSSMSSKSCLTVTRKSWEIMCQCKARPLESRSHMLPWKGLEQNDYERALQSYTPESEILCLLTTM